MVPARAPTLNELQSSLSSLRIDRSRPRSRRFRWPGLLLALAILTAGGYAGWRWWLERPLQVDVLLPETLWSGDGANEKITVLTATGYLVPRRKAVVSSKIQGRLAELHVEEGSRVRLGEVIARLESADIEAQIERARANVQLEEAQLAEETRKLKLAEALHESGVVNEDDVQAAGSRVRIREASVRSAKADVDLVEAYLDNTLIKAPFDGVVVKKMAEVGESVAPIPPGVNISVSSGAIVAMADLETLEVDADAGEAHVSKLSEGQLADVVVEAIPSKTYHGRVRQILPTADRTKATVTVKVTILDKDEDLKPEMSAKVTFLEKPAPAGSESQGGGAGSVERRRIVRVPAEAIARRGGESFVFEVVDGKTARQRRVVLGPEGRGKVVVESGLGGGEQLVLSPPDGLEDGAPVRPREATGPSGG